MQNHIKKVGFLGGTFDPIHFGHLNLALHMKEHFNLDLVLFSCTSCNPFKLKKPPKVSLECRMKMLEKAVDEIEYFSVSDIEKKFEKTSYTIDALRELKKIYIDSDIFLIVSNEIAKDITNWKSSNEIFDLANIVVGTREKKFENEIVNNKISKENYLNIPIFEISATQIRERLKNKLYCGHLVPYKTLKYIEEQGFYQS